MCVDKFQNNNYIVYTRRLAYKLRLRGFRIIGWTPDRDKPYLDNYIFEDTPALRQAIAELKHEK